MMRPYVTNLPWCSRFSQPLPFTEEEKGTGYFSFLNVPLKSSLSPFRSR